MLFLRDYKRSAEGSSEYSHNSHTREASFAGNLAFKAFILSIFSQSHTVAKKITFYFNPILAIIKKSTLHFLP
jgi:hypothetical protein